MWPQCGGGERVWAIEDCRHVSGRSEQALLAGVSESSGCRPTGWALSARASASRAGLNRSTRSRSPAPSSRTGSVESFAVAHLDEEAMEIRLLLDHPRQLVLEVGEENHGEYEPTRIGDGDAD